VVSYQLNIAAFSGFLNIIHPDFDRVSKKKRICSFVHPVVLVPLPYDNIIKYAKEKLLSQKYVLLFE
jgi:hypothetical protein